MKMLKTLVAAVVLSLASVAAFATNASWSNGTVSHIVYETTEQSTGGFVYVIFTTNGGGSASCASGYRNSIVIDTSTLSGAAALSVFQLALASGTTVYSVVGTGACTTSSVIENLGYVEQ